MTPLEAIKAIKAILDQTDMTEPVLPVTIKSNVTVDSGVVLKATPTVIKAPPVVVPPVGILATPATISKVLADARGGDTVLLMAGTYPAMTISKAYDKPLIITSAEAKNARINSVHFAATAKNVTLKNLSLWREPSNPGYLVRSYEGATGIVIEGCDIRALEDSVSYMDWDKAKWLTVAGINAIDMRSGATVRYNHIRGVGRALLMGKNSVVENNLIEGMTADGLRGVSDSVFRNNLVKNFFKVDATHRDAFQSYSGNTVTNLRVENNTLIGFDGPMDHPLRGDPQGIGMFDGFYENFVIKGNTVVTSHYHGITVLGGRWGTITENTVVNIDGSKVDYPWIRVGTHKDGRPSEGVDISYNRAMDYGVTAGVSLIGNETITNPQEVLDEIEARAFNPFSL